MKSAFSPPELRRRNRSVVLRHIVRNGSASRTALADETGLTGTAITRIIRELIELGLLEERNKEGRDGQSGRRRTSLELRADGAYVLGINLHSSERSVTLSNLRGETIKCEHLPILAFTDPHTAFRHAAQTCQKLFKYSKSTGNVVLGIGVAVAGVIDAERQVIREVPQFGWQNYPLAESFGEMPDIPLFIENVNNTLNLGEWRFGLSAGANNVFMARISTFIGGSVISEGALLRGNASGAAQLGHMTVNPDGLECVCGRRGCLNTEASGLAILADYREAPWHEVLQGNLEQNTQAIAELMVASTKGDVRAQQALKRAGKKFGAAAAMLSCVLDPEIILLGGPVGRAQSYIEGVRAGLKDNPPRHYAPTPTLLISKMSTTQATIYTALDRYAFSPKLDIGALSRSAEKQRAMQEISLGA